MKIHLRLTNPGIWQQYSNQATRRAVGRPSLAACLISSPPPSMIVLGLAPCCRRSSGHLLCSIAHVRTRLMFTKACLSGSAGSFSSASRLVKSSSPAALYISSLKCWIEKILTHRALQRYVFSALVYLKQSFKSVAQIL